MFLLVVQTFTGNGVVGSGRQLFQAVPDVVAVHGGKIQRGKEIFHVACGLVCDSGQDTADGSSSGIAGIAAVGVGFTFCRNGGSGGIVIRQSKLQGGGGRGGKGNVTELA